MCHCKVDIQQANLNDIRNIRYVKGNGNHTKSG